MYALEELKESIGTLFRDGAEDNGYSERDIEGLLESIDFESLLQAVRHNAQSVYKFVTEGQYEGSYDYRSGELFDQRAALLYDTLDDSSSETALISRVYELWLLEDMSIAVVVCTDISYDNGQYETEYREVKSGTPWDTFFPDLEAVKSSLDLLCSAVYDREVPLYELS